MEQEVEVTIHRGEPKDPVQEPQHETKIPEQLKELSETISETFSSFRESESYEWLLKSADKAKEYIKKNPTPAILVSLGAGALLGLFMKKRR
jgi:ElaB/YqjD/DUF883 family membrane-anchored ribosome-binding protein